MKDNKLSIVIEDLAATNKIREISGEEAKKISGGATGSYAWANADGSLVQIQSDGSFRRSQPDGSMYWRRS